MVWEYTLVYYGIWEYKSNLLLQMGILIYINPKQPKTLVFLCISVDHLRFAVEKRHFTIFSPGGASNADLGIVEMVPSGRLT